MAKSNAQDVNTNSLLNKEVCPHCGSDKGFEPGVVLDPFCGSSTTGVVANRLGRKFIGIDLNEDYCKIAKKRILKEIGQQKLF